MTTKRCDQCEALMINGVFCHETGCPNSKKQYDAESGEWVTMVTCFICGYDHAEGTICCEE
jgi:hypothetical protein